MSISMHAFVCVFVRDALAHMSNQFNLIVQKQCCFFILRINSICSSKEIERERKSARAFCEKNTNLISRRIFPFHTVNEILWFVVLYVCVCRLHLLLFVLLTLNSFLSLLMDVTGVTKTFVLFIFLCMHCISFSFMFFFLLLSHIHSDLFSPNKFSPRVLV